MVKDASFFEFPKSGQNPHGSVTSLKFPDAFTTNCVNVVRYSVTRFELRVNTTKLAFFSSSSRISGGTKFVTRVFVKVHVIRNCLKFGQQFFSTWYTDCKHFSTFKETSKIWTRSENLSQRKINFEVNEYTQRVASTRGVEHVAWIRFVSRASRVKHVAKNWMGSGSGTLPSAQDNCMARPGFGNERMISFQNLETRRHVLRGVKGWRRIWVKI